MNRPENPTPDEPPTSDARGDAAAAERAPAQPIDWAVAARTAAALAPPGPRMSARQARAETEGLRAAAEASVPHVHRLTRLAAAEDLRDSQLLVVDRGTWAKANTHSFQALLRPTFDHLARTRPGEYRTSTHPLATRATATELGGILAWLSSKVLGQYDPFSALTPGPDGDRRPGSGGRLMLVAPNVAMVRAELNVIPEDFRMWVCLHEQTHRVQFAAAPWLAEHLRDEITGFTSAMFDKSESLSGRLRAALLAARPGGDEAGPADGAADGHGVPAPRGGLMAALHDEEDRARMSRLTAVMSLLEGHANVVMDGVDASVVSSVKTIRRRFGERQQRRSPLDRWVRRMLGMDAKMRQYQDGQRFVTAVVEQLGMDGFNVVWDAPELLPTEAEVHAPEQWVRRIRATA
ncbi:coenzyme F420 biosynthesis associated uncharacterized protein [Micrococcus cohnii]|uniref:Coenzyme F420 biosynthesis associated uncharacterized protein n=1 Tax=Micrococcus cohnii TaxID=993416 RepID=A0A7W7GQA1_9MICC|nr:zinc-dependent metalloprotease [Micrococcus cohnii]MBB4736327.1 coenzyme F420 biosynthesis associated uncharacterized protein [Micrococcus cohnii]